MRVYNYASFAKVFSKGIIKPNMTKIAKILFEPVISLGDCVNRHGEPYTIDNKSASLWYKQEADIPGNLKKAANDGRVYKGIGKYYTDEVLDKALSGVKADDFTLSLLLKRGDCYALTNGRKVHMLIRLVMNYFRGLLSTFPPFKKKSFRLYRNLQEGGYERKKLAY